MNKLKKWLVVSFTFVMVFAAEIGIGNYGNIPEQVYADVTVYVTPTGSKYHSHKCGNGRFYASTLSAAQARGLEPCKKCYGSNPPSASSASNDTPKKANIRLNKKSVTLLDGQSVKLKVKGTSAAVTWKSTNKKVASVDTKGKVKGKTKGKAKIIAKVNGRQYICKVKVETPVLSETAITLREGEHAYLEVKGCSHDVEWDTDDYEIVDVDEGDIYAYEEGETKVYATVHGKTYTCVVTVLPDNGETAEPETTVIYYN